MQTVRWLLIGAGDIAVRRVAPALTSVEHSVLEAVCDIDNARAGALADRYGAGAVYTDVAEALSKTNANSVYIATPQSTHIAIGLQVVAADKHMLCEKPLGLSGKDCLKLLASARGSKRIMSCSNYRRLSEQYRQTAQMLDRGEIGRPLGGWAVYSTPFYNPGGAPIRQALGSSRIKELGFYLIDIVHNLLGMPVSVTARASIIDKAVMNDVEDIATVILTLAGGQLFTIVFNCGSPGTRHEMEFFGSEGRIYWPGWPPHGNGPVIKVTASGTERVEAETDQNWHRPMIHDFVEAVRFNRPPVCTLESAAKTEIVTDAIFRSIESGRLEPVLWEDDL